MQATELLDNIAELQGKITLAHFENNKELEEHYRAVQIKAVAKLGQTKHA